jgi:hypothetical protein
MATVIHALWVAGDQAPLILPASVPLSDAAVVAELTRNLDDAWKPIIDADIDGEGSLPLKLDAEFKNLGRYLAARRVARTVFLGSAPRVGSPNQGIDAARVRLGCALPGETVAIYGDALNRIADRATYFYVGGGRYWYGTQPGVARLARDRAERLLTGDRHEIHDHVIWRLRSYEDRRRRGDFAGVHAAPNSPSDVADTAEARLVIIGLDWPHVPRSDASPALLKTRTLLESRGPAPRDYRNMLVFLAADQRRVDDLEQAVAEYLAWAEIVRDAAVLNLDPQQGGQAISRRDDAGRTVDLRLADAYQWLLVPRQPEPAGPTEWEEIKADGQGELVERAGRKLIHGGGLYLSYPPVLLRLQLDGPLASLWESGDATVNAVWDAYARYLYLHRLRDIDTLCLSVAEAPMLTTWEAEGVAVAEDRDSRTGAYLGLIGGGRATNVRGTTLLVRPDIAESQLEAEPGRITGVLEKSEVREPHEQKEPPRLRRFYGVTAVDSSRLGRDAGRIAEEVVAHLNALVGTVTDVTIEIRSTNDNGFPEEVIRVVNENAATLRFRHHDFEPDE